MTKYEIDGLTVRFTPWHSEYMDEDFIAVSIWKDGRELMHAGMTHVEPSGETARREVEYYRVLASDKKWSTAGLMPMHSVEPDGYCAWGERREA